VIMHVLLTDGILLNMVKTEEATGYTTIDGH
jgi:hypothetical protein